MIMKEVMLVKVIYNDVCKSGNVKMKVFFLIKFKRLIKLKNKYKISLDYDHVISSDFV